MTFAHLGFLVGLGAAAVPVLLHFLRTRRLRRAFFSSLALLRRVHQERARRMKLTQLLLLAIRVGIVLALTLAFAQPLFTDPRLAHLNPGPRACVVIWDNPLAMGVRERAGGGPTAADVARERLGRLLAPMPAADRLVVIATSPAAHTVFAGVGKDLVLAQLPGPSAGASDMSGALAQAASALERTAAADRLLVIVSDFRRRTFPETGRELPQARTLLVPVRSGEVANWGLTGLTIEPPTAVAGDEVTITAQLAPSSASATMPTSIALSIDGRIVERRAQPAAATHVRAQFKWRAQGAGAHRVGVRLSPDGLDGDNERTSVVFVVGQRKVLLVNGHKRANPSQDDGHFLRRVFGSERSPRPGIVAREVLQLSAGESLADLDLVALANVSDVPQAALDRLEAFVQRGGTLLVFLGDQVQPGTYNAGLLKLVPSLSIERHAAGGGAWHVPEPVPGALETLFEDSYWRGIHSDTYFLLRRAPGASAIHTAVTLEDGTGAVVLAECGRGTVILVNAGGTTANSDLPLHPIFPVLAMEAMRLSTARPVPSYPVGSIVPLTLDPRDPTPSQLVQAPDGHLYTERPVRAGDSVVVRFEHTERPGVYEVARRAAGAGSSEFFAVDPPASESDLTVLTPTQMAQRLPGATVVAPGEAATGARASAMPSVVDVLLGLLALLLLMEAVVVFVLEKAMLPGGPQ